jgi:hypothetical protein
MAEGKVVRRTGEGDALWLLGGLYEVKGDFFYLPQGTLENFEPTGDTPLRILVIYTPGGIDRFFHEAGEPAQARELPPPPDSPPDVERLVEIGGRYGMEIAPPG